MDVHMDKKRTVDNVQMDKVNKSKNVQPQGPSVLKEINLQEEFRNMEEVIEPKGKKEDEKTYKCGKCSGTFKEKTKHCPHCGVEF